MFRRLTACLLMLCLSLFSAESLIADVHDDDPVTGTPVTGAAVRGAAGIGDARATAASVSHLETASHAPGDVHVPTGAHPGGHVEHCTHAHTAPPALLSALPAVQHDHVGAIGTPAAALVSRDLPPQLRPPIG